jgi:release factor glutamine methyltransferase
MLFFKQFVSKLSAIYDKNEAEAIAHIVFENLLISTSKKEYITFDSKKIIELNLFANFQNALYRLLANEPVQYIVGKMHFGEFGILVNKKVLIPRPETEELVFLMQQKIKHQTSISMIDFCTGSGCIAIALASKNKSAKIYALEKSKQALNVANKNAALNNVAINFIEADIFSWQSDLQFDYMISNPPYIKMDEKQKMDANVLLYEPAMALFVANNEPLIFYKKIKEIASSNLKIGGEIFLEINAELGIETVALFMDTNFSAELVNDMYSKPRFVFAKKLS